MLVRSQCDTFPDAVFCGEEQHTARLGTAAEEAGRETVSLYTCHPQDPSCRLYQSVSRLHLPVLCVHERCAFSREKDVLPGDVEVPISCVNRLLGVKRLSFRGLDLDIHVWFLIAQQRVIGGFISY